MITFRLPLALVAFLTVAASAQPNSLAIHSAYVVDVETGEVRAGQTVLVVGDRIGAVGPGAEVDVPEGATVFDADGSYLIPGLWDMHVHSMSVELLPIYYPMYVALGITGVREMASFYFPLDSALVVRERIRDGDLLGPRFVTAGEVIDGVPKTWPFGIEVQNAEQGRHVADSLLTEGADFLKVYDNLSRDTYVAIADVANARGVPFAGHTPRTLTPAEVSDAGQRSIEHYGRIAEFCTSGGEAFYWAAGANTADDDAIYAQLLQTHNAALCRPLFERFVQNSTYIVPTLVQQRGRAFMNDSTRVRDPRARFMPSYFTEGSWDYTNDSTMAAWPEASWDLRRRLFRDVDQPLVGEMRRAGVQILAGSDAPNPHVPYGFGLHDELALLVEAGLTPLEALQAATINPARFLEREGDLGTIEAGKLADLVLLDANPLEDIANTQRIRTVVVNGRLLDQAEREAILASVERAVER